MKDELTNYLKDFVTKRKVCIFLHKIYTHVTGTALSAIVNKLSF